MACLPCKEIIDNGLTAIAADLFATFIAPVSKVVADIAHSLAETARAAVAMYDVARGSKVIDMTGEFRWEGCHKATQIMAWLLTAKDVATDANVEQMRQWRVEILRDMANLVAGGRAVE